MALTKNREVDHYLDQELRTLGVGAAKNVFKGAAMTVVQKLPATPLHADYQRLVDRGLKPNLAQLTIARKIAAIALAVWKSNQPYDPARATTNNNKGQSVNDKASNT